MWQNWLTQISIPHLCQWLIQWETINGINFNLNRLNTCRNKSNKVNKRPIQLRFQIYKEINWWRQKEIEKPLVLMGWYNIVKWALFSEKSILSAIRIKIPMQFFRAVNNKNNLTHEMALDKKNTLKNKNTVRGYHYAWFLYQRGIVVKITQYYGK